MYAHLWNQLRERDPQHSANYAERWRTLAAQGLDLDGEARFVSALAAPGSRVLDAGSGQGRLGGYLSAHGYSVAGVDLDEVLVAEARALFPQAEWHVGDLAQFDLCSLHAAAPTAPQTSPGFDVIVSAGNVLTFIDPAARHSTLINLAHALAPEGRLVTGFGAGRGYAFDAFEQDLHRAGLTIEHRFASWDMRPYTEHSDFLVCVAASTAAGPSVAP